MMPVHYELYDDARRYDCGDADLQIPVLVFQGRRDTAVDPAIGRSAGPACGPNVELHLLDDDHQLAPVSTPSGTRPSLSDAPRPTSRFPM